MEVGFRKSNLTLVLQSALAVGAGVATFIATAKARISHAQLSLSDSGTGAGSTAVQVNINGSPVLPAGGLSLPGAGASKAVAAMVTLGSNEFPGGARINPGDVVTVDVLSVPATTVPKQATVILELTQIDV